MMQKEADNRKEKITGVFALINEMEAEYWDAFNFPKDGVVPPVPHLMDIAIINPQHVAVWYTIEPMTHEGCKFGVQGWDVKRRMVQTWLWEEIWDANINMLNYVPVTAQEWRQRTRLTNMQHVEENLIVQVEGKYW